jgi:hypothetical protein
MINLKSNKWYTVRIFKNSTYEMTVSYGDYKTVEEAGKKINELVKNGVEKRENLIVTTVEQIERIIT